MIDGVVFRVTAYIGDSKSKDLFHEDLEEALLSYDHALDVATDNEVAESLISVNLYAIQIIGASAVQLLNRTSFAALNVLIKSNEGVSK